MGELQKSFLASFLPVFHPPAHPFCVAESPAAAMALPAASLGDSPTQLGCCSSRTEMCIHGNLSTPHQLIKNEC